MSSDFYNTSIGPYAPIIIKICRAYTNTQADFEDYYQEVCLQIWRSHRSFDERAAWSTWIYRVSLNVCMTLLKTQILGGIDRVLGAPRLVEDLKLHIGVRKQVDADDMIALAQQARRRRWMKPPSKPLPPPATGAAKERIDREAAAVEDAELRDLIRSVRTRHDR